jgi:hypothetical protein
MLPAVPDPALGTAIIYQGLVEQACAWLAAAAPGEGAAGRPRGWRTLLGRRGGRPVTRRRRGRCPVCVELVASEWTYLDTLARGVLEAELGAAYAASSGLCLPHVELALARRAGGSGAERLAALTLDRLRGLAGELRRFIDKHDHRVPATFTVREAEGWTSALELIAGRPELFGHQIERTAAPVEPEETDR